MTKLSSLSLIFFSVALGLVSHGIFLSHWPGIHYDEAWAALYAARIATEKSFYPFAGMSPYTMPWSHYWAALFFEVFGISLSVYRVSQLTLTFLGVFFVVHTLKRNFSLKHGLTFGALVALCPMAILNHRFGIELTGWHVFCWGLFLWASYGRHRQIAMIAAVLGVTAHILFLGFLLAWFFLLLLEDVSVSRGERNSMVSALLLLFPFFFHIAQTVPEQGKALSVCTLVFVLIPLIVFYFELMRNLARLLWPWLKRLVLFAALPFTANLIIYSEGHWLQAINSGITTHDLTLGLPLLAMLGFSIPSLRNIKNASHLRSLGFFVALVCIMLGAMMLKPAPRYYELAMLSGLLFLTFLWSNLPRTMLWTALVCYGVISLASVYIHSELLWRQNNFAETNLRFGPLKDNSVDFLPKQKLAQFLGLKGCAFSAIRGGDPRILTALQFLSYGDWPLAQGVKCPWPVVRVERSAASPTIGAVAELGAFRIFAP